ncbi:MAG: hypothetical protein Q7K43_03810 [Candidatus Woesearchaeota archaeon]|nr:hypothetical protein [Candidatus Woesearchaeota archaeon]
MDTQQFNFRVSKSILFDLEFISRATGLDKNDWVRYKLAEAIRAEKEASLDKIERDYVNSRIDANQFKELSGYSPSEGLDILREKRLNKLAGLKSDNHTKYAKAALLENVPSSKRRSKK